MPPARLNALARHTRRGPDHRHALVRLAGVVPGVVAASGLAAGGDSLVTTDVVSLETARAGHEAGRAVLIDIREPEEQAGGVVAGARLLPMRQLQHRLAEIPASAAQSVLPICNTQNRSSATLRALRAQGDGPVRDVSGGMGERARRGWPMAKPGTRPGA